MQTKMGKLSKLNKQTHQTIKLLNSHTLILSNEIHKVVK
jgi:hypothetical protein